ncbi:putative hydrolase [Cenococcum geophilum]
MQSHIEPERFGFTEPKRRRLLSAAEGQEARWVQQGSEQQAYETGGGTKLHTPFQQRRYAEEILQVEPSINQLVRHPGQGDQIDQPHEELLVAEQYWTDTRSSCNANSFPSLLSDISGGWHHSKKTTSLTEAAHPRLEPKAELDPAEILVGDVDRSHLYNPLVKKASANDEQVCFGMVSGLGAEIQTQFTFEIATPLAVRFDSSISFTTIGECPIQGSIATEHSHIVQALREDHAIDLQVQCDLDGKTASASRKRGLDDLSRTICSLSIIIYGSGELFEDIGRFFQDCGLFLQDPRGCDRNVRYRNPHRLSARISEDCAMTFDLDDSFLADQVENLQSPKDLLEILNTEEDLLEAKQPHGLRTTLSRHQKQALTFMNRREKVWNLNSNAMDLWKEIKSTRGRAFVNQVTETCRSEPPPQFSGGILADPMGLGKTLTMISLIASDAISSQSEPCLLDVESPPQNFSYRKPTLVIMPPPLISAWEEQFKEHLQPNSLRWYRYHGRNRVSCSNQLNQYDIIITTYHTVSAEWKKAIDLKASTLFATRWRRVILDEAHWIRNCSSQIAKAICALEAVSRWAVTGTPLQNRLSDLAALFKFLRVYPYYQPKVFETDIIQIWKQGNEEEAVKRLKTLLRCLLLRRSKSTIQLPRRHDTVCYFEFSPEESSIYEEAKTRAVRALDEALSSGSEASGSYLNVLQQINSLRMICNLGVYYRPSTENSCSASPANQEWTSQLAQRYFNSLLAFGNTSCYACSIDLETSEYIFSAAGRKPERQAHLSRCLRLFCPACLDKGAGTAVPVPYCGHSPPCSISPVVLSGSTEYPKRRNTPDLLHTLPTKVAALVFQLKSLDSATKRYYCVLVLDLNP